MDEIFVEKKVVKEGANDGRPWKRTAVKDVISDDWLSTFDEGLAAKLEEGKRYRVEYESKPVNGRVLKTLKSVEPIEAEEPPNGGEPIRARENPSTQRSISASVALQQAVTTMSHTVGTSMTPKEASERVLPLAAEYFRWLLQRTGLETDADIPF
jgi:hypothetical protein